MRIDHIDTNRQIFIVAEIGNNHEGDFVLAQDMIHLAAEAGADAVKFQTFRPEFLSGGDEARSLRLKKFQLSYEQFGELSKIANSKKLIFFSTPFDLESAKVLNGIQPVFKIASSDNDHQPLIKQVAHFVKPLIVSTGLATLNLVARLEKDVREIWATYKKDPGLALLHCVSSYPTPVEQANLKAISVIKEVFPSCVAGYSDHTSGINAVLGAVSLGARIIEKHFTINKQYSTFRDHEFSADPLDLQEMVTRIREIDLMLGDERKTTQLSEVANEAALRRSAAAGRDLSAGHVLRDKDLMWVRPGTGIRWEERDRLLGYSLNRPLKYAELIRKGDLT